MEEENGLKTWSKVREPLGKKGPLNRSPENWPLCADSCMTGTTARASGSTSSCVGPRQRLQCWKRYYRSRYRCKYSWYCKMGGTWAVSSPVPRSWDQPNGTWAVPRPVLPRPTKMCLSGTFGPGTVWVPVMILGQSNPQAKPERYLRRYYHSWRSSNSTVEVVPTSGYRMDGQWYCLLHGHNGTPGGHSGTTERQNCWNSTN